MKLFDSTFSAIEKKLDLTLRRHTVLSGNVANNETPNYKARDVSFASEVAKALGSEKKEMLITNSRHMDVSSLSGSHIYIDNSMSVGADGNNVDLDIQMGKLSDNSRQYSGALNLLTVKLKMLKSAATGGRGGF
ncbi:MAG TPA: flagellar basal body rod protein FlgB [Oligoflexia bacterium]|nr:flagellar basal body rod protein FlgB [Oligoflexia bacterium]HMP47579.1 flagellar basal body rod protein FlgB [Oligoflexia bacterium]